jgi:MFS family permease
MSFDPDDLRPAWRAPKSLTALGYRDYALFWASGVVSNSGSMMYLAAIGWVVLVETDSPFKVTLVAALGMLPLLIMSPVGGWLADRMPRRDVMLLSVVLSTIVAGALSVTYAAGWASFPVLLAFSLVGGSAASLGAPVMQAIIPELVPSEALRNGVVLNGVQFNAARAVGPMMAGLIIDQWGAATAFWVNTLSFGAMILALLMMRPRPAPSDAEHQGFITSFLQGARYMRSERGLVLAMVLGMVVGFALAPMQWLVPVIATDLFDANASQFGLLAGAFGVGSITGAIILLNVDTKVTNRQLISLGLPGLVIGIAALALSPVLALGVIAMAIAGLSFMTVMATLLTAMQTICADAFRGRVMSLWMMVFGVTLPLGTLIQGSFAEVVSTRLVLLADAVLIGAVVAYVLARHLLRYLDVTGEATAAEDGPPANMIDPANG